MCLVALDISKEVKFAAVTDTNGKLIAGKLCKDDKINNSLVKTRLFQLSSAEAKENRQNSLNSTLHFVITIRIIFSIQITWLVH